MKLPVHRVRRLIISIAFGLSLTVNSLAIDFDATFGSSGKFMTSFSDSGQPSSGGSQLFIQPSGRIVVVGTHSQQGTSSRTSGIALAGLTPAGVLDGRFGSRGRVLSWDPASHQSLNNSLMSPDGSIVVLYQMWQSVAMNRPVIVKFSPDGHADPSFQADVDIVANQTSPVRIALGDGGKIYVLVRNFDFTQFSLIRLNQNGSRDITFGTNGVRNLNLNRFNQPTVTGLIELENGKLLVVGTYYDQMYEGLTFVARFDSDANIDRSFGLQGATRISIPGGSAGAIATKIQPDGKILLGGYWTFLGSNTLLVRLTQRGRLDHTFGTGGIAMTSFNNTNVINGIALSPDGKIIASGGSGAKAVPSNQRLFIMRYSSTGVRESFLVTNFISNREAGASDVVLQADGKILISGFTQNPSDNFSQLAAARFVP